MRSNTEYEILSPDGHFYDFKGVIQSTKTLHQIKIQDGDDIWASDNHIFFVNGIATKVSNLSDYGFIDSIDGPIAYQKTFNYNITYAYDVVECQEEDHLYTINSSIITHNCDEFAFVANNISEHFWTSISPTLSTGGNCIIASTPNGDDNLYAELWRGAESGANGFTPIFVKWDTVPGRDERFREQEIAKIGLTKFQQEYECLRGDTLVTILDSFNTERTLTLKELYDEFE
jgi:hypothetical protein